MTGKFLHELTDAGTLDGDELLYIERVGAPSVSFKKTVADYNAELLDSLPAELDTRLGGAGWRGDGGTAIAINSQTGVAYTLVIDDAGKIIEMNNASANVLTVPSNATVAFPVNSYIEIVQMGAGVTTIAAAGGVTIRSRSGLLSFAAQYSAGSLYKRGTNEWVLIGDLA